MKLNIYFLIGAILYSFGSLDFCNCQNLRTREISRKLELWPEWPNNSYNEVKIPVYNNLCKSAWDRYLTGSAGDWSRSNAVLLQVVTNYGPRICDNSMVTYENVINVVERWDPSWNMASFTRSNVYKDNMGKRRFKSAIVILNDAILMNPTLPSFSYEMRMKSMCKSIGFALGLYNAGANYGTISDTDSCMDTSSLSLLPSSRDFDMLGRMYFDENNRQLLDEEDSMNMTFSDSKVNQTLVSFLNTHESITAEEYDEENRDKINIYHQPIDINDVGDLVEETYVDGVRTKFYVQDNDDFVSYAVKVEYDNE